MAQFYAWSDIHTSDKVIATGDKVDQKMLGVSDDEWESLVENGVVRNRKHPPTNVGESPREYSLRKLAELQEAAGDVSFTEDDEDEPEAPAK